MSYKMQLQVQYKQNNVRCWPTFLANYQHKCNYYLDLHEAVLYLSRLTILWVVCMKAGVEQCLSQCSYTFEIDRLWTSGKLLLFKVSSFFSHNTSLGLPVTVIDLTKFLIMCNAMTISIYTAILYRVFIKVLLVPRNRQY